MRLSQRDIEKVRCPKCGSWTKLMINDSNGEYRYSICLSCKNKYVAQFYIDRLDARVG